MRILADENVSGLLVRRLRAEGYDLRWVLETHRSSNDSTVLTLAGSMKRTLLTFDSDFGELAVRNLRPAPFGIIYCRFRGLNLDQQALRVADVLAEHATTLSLLIVVENERHRVRNLTLE